MIGKSIREKSTFITQYRLDLVCYSLNYSSWTTGVDAWGTRGKFLGQGGGGGGGRSSRAMAQRQTFFLNITTKIQVSSILRLLRLLVGSWNVMTWSKTVSVCVCILVTRKIHG